MGGGMGSREGAKKKRGQTDWRAPECRLFFAPSRETALSVDAGAGFGYKPASV